MKKLLISYVLLIISINLIGCKKCFTCSKEIGTDASGQVTTVDEQNVCVYGGGSKSAAKEYENDGYTCNY